MYKFGQLFKKKKGSLTVEAAISLPIFMCVFLSILFFIRVIYIQNNVQYALNGAANELSTYSYLYSVSGLQKVNNEIGEITTENSELASEHTIKLLESFDALSENFQEGLESAKQLSEGDLSQIESLKGIYDKSLPPAENVKNVLGDALSDPKREFVSIASLFLNSGYEELKRNLAEPLVKFYMKKYIDPKIISSKGGPGAYISVKEGQDPFKLFDFGKDPVFDFSKSKIFTDNKTIDLVVRYKIKTALPINFLPEIQMEQRATVRAWLDGDGSARVKKPEPTVEEGTSVWDLAQFDYGKIISEKELSKYPDRHPKSGDAYEVRSINLDSKSYINNPKAIKSSLKTTINKFHSKTAGKSDITSRTLIVVVPEGTMSDDIRKIFEELENECSALSPPIKLIYKEGYGRQTNRQEEASDKSVEDSDEEEPSPTVKKSDLVILLPNTPVALTPTPTVAATPTPTPNAMEKAIAEAREAGIIEEELPAFAEFLTRSEGQFGETSNAIKAFKYLSEGDFTSFANMLDLSTPPGKAVFWSKNKDAAKRYADSIDGFALETTIGGKILDEWEWLDQKYPTWDEKKPTDLRPLWIAVSIRYASLVEGPVTVVRPGGEKGEGGYVWTNYELPILDKRNITIIYVDSADVK